VTPPCHGQHALFDSVVWEHHLQAKALCDACPLIDACRRLLADVQASNSAGRAGGPRGTWAGQLLGAAPGRPRIKVKRPRKVKRPSKTQRGVTHRVCTRCGVDLGLVHPSTKYCTSCRTQARRESHRRHKERAGRRTEKYSEADRRRAHNRYVQGDRTPWVVEANREYKRVHARRLREARRGSQEDAA